MMGNKMYEFIEGDCEDCVFGMDSEMSQCVHAPDCEFDYCFREVVE